MTGHWSPTPLSSSLPISRSAISTAIKLQMTVKHLRRTSALNMKLISSSLTVLIFITTVFSAAMREGSEDLLRFLHDAFEMNLPPDHLEPTKVTETETILDTANPTVECKAPEIVAISADASSLSQTKPNPATPKPNIVEITGITEERSIENSNSADNTNSRVVEKASAEDSRDIENDRRSQLKTSVTDSSKVSWYHSNSAESNSMDRTDMNTELHEGTNKSPSKAAVKDDISSQEMDRPGQNGEFQSERTKRMLQKSSTKMAVASDRKDLDIVKEIHPIIQTMASRINLKDQTDPSHNTEKHQQESNKRTVDFDSPEVMDTPDRQDLADSEELGFGRIRLTGKTLRLMSDQSKVKTTSLSNQQTNRSEDKERQDLDTGSKKHEPSQIKFSVETRVKVNSTANLTSVNQTTLESSWEITDQNPGCLETSVQHPKNENNSLDAPNVDQEIQKDMMNYQNHLRKLCPSKRVRVSNSPRVQLDLDSPERVNSEHLDSNEKLEDHVTFTL